MSFYILDIKIDNYQREELPAKLFSKNPPYKQVVTLNPHIFMKALVNQKLKAIINQASCVIADGHGVVWAAKKRQIPISERIAGIDLAYDLLGYANQHKKSVYLLGSTSQTVTKARAQISSIYRGLKVVGCHHGYFKKDKEADIIAAIRKAQPDILFAGLGSGRQELWLGQNLNQLKCKIAIGIGGGIEIFAGKTKRAPAPFLKLRMEWLYRTLPHLSRWPRFFTLIGFVIINIFRK